MKWKPIDTAPRDGTVIKLLIPYSSEKFTEAECTDVGYWLDISQIAGGDIRTPGWAKKWGGCFIFNGCDGAFDIQPTHWQTLPKPPETP